MLKPHPKWGMNPTHLGCYACGERFDEVFLFGDSLDAKAPPVSCFPEESSQHRICDVCEEHMAQGIIYVLVNPTKVTMKRNEDGTMEEDIEFSRTGTYLAMTEYAIREMYEDEPEKADGALEYRIHLLTPPQWEAYGFPEPSTITGEKL